MFYAYAHVLSIYSGKFFSNIQINFIFESEFVYIVCN